MSPEILAKLAEIAGLIHTPAECSAFLALVLWLCGESLAAV